MLVSKETVGNKGFVETSRRKYEVLIMNFSPLILAKEVIEELEEGGGLLHCGRLTLVGLPNPEFSKSGRVILWMEVFCHIFLPFLLLHLPFLFNIICFLWYFLSLA